jgi:hypothetical protein
MPTDDDRAPPFAEPADSSDAPVGSTPRDDAATDPPTLSQLMARHLAAPRQRKTMLGNPG